MEHGALRDLCRIAVEIESPSHVDTHSDQLMKHFKKIDPFDGLNVWVKKESERKVPARSRGEASKNLEITNARAEYERILKEGYELRESLRKLISQWAKP